MRTDRLLWLVVGLAIGCISGLIIAELPGNSRADRAERRAAELQERIASLEDELADELATAKQIEDALTTEILKSAQRDQEIRADLKRLEDRGREVAEAMEAAIDQP